jgi:hypothetical protein
LTASGSVNDGNGGNNYQVMLLATNTAGQITIRPITVTAAAATKMYDGTTTSSAKATVTSGGLVGSDTLTTTEVFDNRNAGSGKTLNLTYMLSDGNGGNNYQVTLVPSTAGQITLRPITVSAVANTKIYDGTATSSATPTVTSGSLVGGDTLTFTETFDGRNVGAGRTLAAAGSVSDGDGGNNYQVTLVPSTAGQITPRPITLTAAPATKTYNGTSMSSATPTVTSGSLEGGDSLAFTETFDTRNVGTGKTLTAAGSVNDGNGGNNYQVTLAATNTAGAITPQSLTVMPSANIKTYDGTTSAAAIPSRRHRHRSDGGL